jgi:pimeloyl-ACP methyl ester carboxylesterase
VEFESDGVRLHFEMHGPDDGKPIVLVHGFASHYRLNWVGTRWQETLTNTGFRVIGLDCRGNGASHKPHDPAAYALATMAADVRRLLDYLGIELADYLGYSMGARVGLQAVVDYPDRWRRVVLGGLGLKGAFDQASSIAHAMRGGSPENDVAKSFHEFAAAQPANDLDALAACIEGQQQAFDDAQLASIRVPILIVVGEKDELASSAPELVERIPTARLVTVSARDHMGTVPSRDFKAAAQAFLEGV